MIAGRTHWIAPIVIVRADAPILVVKIKDAPEEETFEFTFDDLGAISEEAFSWFREAAENGDLLAMGMTPKFIPSVLVNDRPDVVQGGVGVEVVPYDFDIHGFMGPEHTLHVKGF